MEREYWHGWMDPKGLFLSFLSPYCMCGPTFEVNIQCLLPAFPAVSHRWNFVSSPMRPRSNWAHQNCLFLLLNKQNIALGPQLNLTCITKHSGVDVTTPLKRSTSWVFFVFFFREKQRKLLSFLWAQFGNKNSPKGEFKPGPKSGHPLAQRMVHWIGSWVCFNCCD